jgi:hypothetical protein
VSKTGSRSGSSGAKAVAERIEALALRVREDPFFLASALEEYARSEEMAWEDLAGVLGCAPEQLGPLGLCRRPRSGDAAFLDEIARIAERFDLDMDALTAIARRADTLDAWRGRIAAQRIPSQGWLQAARDRDVPLPDSMPEDDSLPAETEDEE